jgi:hypothetical protein
MSNLTSYLSSSSKAQVHPQEDDDQEYEHPLGSQLRPRRSSKGAGEGALSKSNHSEISHESMDSIGVASTGGHGHHAAAIANSNASTTTLNLSTRSSRSRRYDPRNSQTRERSRSASGRQRRGARNSSGSMAAKQALQASQASQAQAQAQAAQLSLSSSTSRPIQPPQQYTQPQPHEQEKTLPVMVGGDLSEHRRPRVTARGLMLAEMRTKSARKLQEFEELYSNHSESTDITAIISNASAPKIISKPTTHRIIDPDSHATPTTTITEEETSSSIRNAPRTRAAPPRTRSGGKGRRAAATERIRNEVRSRPIGTPASSLTASIAPTAAIVATTNTLGAAAASSTTESTLPAAVPSAASLAGSSSSAGVVKHIRSTSLGRRSAVGRRNISRTKSLDDSDIGLESTGTNSKTENCPPHESSKCDIAAAALAAAMANHNASSASGIHKSSHSSASGGRIGNGGSGSRHGSRGRTRQSGSSHGPKSSSRSRSRSTRRRRRKHQPATASTEEGPIPRADDDADDDHPQKNQQEHDSQEPVDDEIYDEDDDVDKHDSSKFLQLQLDTSKGAAKVVGRSQKEFEVDHQDIAKNYSSSDEGLSLASDIDEEMEEEFCSKPSSTSSRSNKPPSTSSRSNKPSSTSSRSNKPSSTSSRSNKPSSTSSRSNNGMSTVEGVTPERAVSSSSIQVPDDDDKSIEFDVAKLPAQQHEENASGDEGDCQDGDGVPSTNGNKNNKKKPALSDLLNKSTTAFFDVSKKFLSGKLGPTNGNNNRRGRSRSPELFPDDVSVRTKNRCLNELVRETSVRKLQMDGGAILEHSTMAFPPTTPSRKFGRPRLGNLLSRKKNTVPDSHAQLDEDGGSLADPFPKASTRAATARSTITTTTNTAKGEEKPVEACETLEEFFGPTSQGVTNLPVLQGPTLVETEEGTESSEEHIFGRDDEEFEVTLEDLALEKATRKKTLSSSLDNLEDLFFNDAEDDTKLNHHKHNRMHQSMADMSRFVPLRQPSVRGFDEHREVPGNRPSKNRLTSLESIPDALEECDVMSPTPSSPYENQVDPGLLPKSSRPKAPKRTSSLQSPTRQTSIGADSGSDSPRTPSRHQSKIELTAKDRLLHTPPSRSKSSDLGDRPLGRNKTAPGRTRSSSKAENLMVASPSFEARRSPLKSGAHPSALQRSKSGDGMTYPRSRGADARSSPRGTGKSSKAQLNCIESGGGLPPTSTGVQGDEANSRKSARPPVSSSSKKPNRTNNSRDQQKSSKSQHPDNLEGTGGFTSPIRDGTMSNSPKHNQGSKNGVRQGLLSLAEASPLPGKNFSHVGHITPVSIPTSKHGGAFLSPSPQKHGDYDSDDSYEYGEELSPSVDNPTNYLQLAFDAPPPENCPFPDSPSEPTAVTEEKVSDDRTAGAASTSHLKFSMSRLLKSPLVTTGSMSGSTSNVAQGATSGVSGSRSNTNPKKLPQLPPLHASK